MRPSRYTPDISTNPQCGHALEVLNSCLNLTNCRVGQQIPTHECWHHVISGGIRQYSVQTDGRRQIIDLLLTNDWISIPAPGRQYFFCEAIRGTLLASYDRSHVQALVRQDAEVASFIQSVGVETVSRLQRQLLILGRVTALEKVGSFLLEFAERLSAGDQETIELPFSRCDIADYLAISVETVSRCLTDLKHRRVIAMIGARHFKIIDCHALGAGNRH